MDYKEKYEQALEKVKVMLGTGDYTRESLEYVFPELKESEDEKTKRILHSISSKMSFHLRDIFTEEEFQCFDTWSNAWLEKQGEKKPEVDQHSLPVSDDSSLPTFDESIYHPCTESVHEQKSSEWSEEDEINLEKAIWYVENPAHMVAKDSMLVEWIKSLKDRVLPQPKQWWSEEDESHIRYLIECLENCKKGVALTMTTSTAQEYINWLKSLRPQNRWKPSDEQIEYLTKAILTLGNEGDCKTASILNELRTNLKKL